MSLITSLAVDKKTILNNTLTTVRLLSKTLETPGDKYFEGEFSIPANTTDSEFDLPVPIGYLCIASDRNFILKLDNTTSTPINVENIFVLSGTVERFYISNPDLNNPVNITVIANSS